MENENEWVVFTLYNHEEEVVAMPASWLKKPDNHECSIGDSGKPMIACYGESDHYLAEVMQENEARERANWIIGPEEMRRCIGDCEKGTAEEVFFYVNQVWILWDEGYISDDGAMKAVKGGVE